MKKPTGLTTKKATISTKNPIMLGYIEFIINYKTFICLID